MQRIAVWNTAFLGDAVLTLPLLRVLHAVWPEADLDFYVRGGLAELFAAQPELRRVYAFDKRGLAGGFGGLFGFGRQVAKRKYDLWIDAHLSLRSSAMAWLGRAGRRIGYAEAGAAWWAFTDQVGRNFEERPEIERLLALCEPLSIPDKIFADPWLRWPVMSLPLSAQAGADKILAPLPPGPVLGIHPGSVWPTKRWTARGFAHILRLALESGANVLLLGTPEEAELTAEIKTLAGFAKPGDRRFLDLTGKTSIPVLGALIGRMQCYLTNDSGPMHMAWAQGVPVTAVFGPTVEALGFFPRGDSTVFQVEEACRPCGRHGHKKCPQGHFRCMLRVDPDLVWQNVQSKLFPWRAEVNLRKSRLPGEAPDNAE